ncbi:hypothetical protein Tco_0895747 [Tanacetum coccineum]|uniref:Retroviral polymerase SH3-like domain-containing protein n=1 Tax=Tanacetum coccineum TaxID=301880 RepID=A0ABQ5CFG9_9ASTR
MEMLCDNEPTIAITNDPRILKGARHFQRKYHYIREIIQERDIVLKKVHTYDNVVDLFAKLMPFNKHYEHAMEIGIVPASSLMCVLGYSQTRKAYIVLNKETMRIEESLNMAFDESLPEPKSSPSGEDDEIQEQVVQDPIRSPSLEANASKPGCPKNIKEARRHPIEQVIGERMVLSDKPMGPPNNVLDNQIFSILSDDSHASSGEMYLNEEEDSGDSLVEKIRNPLSANHIERGYSICCENTIDMINSIKDHREENRAMFSSINEAIKLMLVIATNMSCVVENDIAPKCQEHLKGNALDLWIPALKLGGEMI